MLLPAGDVHDFRDRRALGPAQQGDDRSLLGIRFRTAARLRRSLGFFPRLARLAGSTPGRRQDDQLGIGEFHGMLRWVGVRHERRHYQSPAEAKWRWRGTEEIARAIRYSGRDARWLQLARCRDFVGILSAQ